MTRFLIFTRIYLLLFAIIFIVFRTSVRHNQAFYGNYAILLLLLLLLLITIVIIIFYT